MVAAGAAGGALARWVGRGTGPEQVRLAPAARPLPPAVPAASLEVDGLSPLFTPNRDFYRIDTALAAPRIDLETWRLRVTGMVDQPLELSFDDLSNMRQVEADITLSCVSNEVGGDLVDNARWRGVPLAELLEQAGVRPGADQVVGRSVDGWTGGFPTAAALDGRDALVALGMNGEALPVVHGFPARLVVPGLYGYVSATKWLSEIELTTLEGFDGYWVPRGWSKLAPVKTQSRIDVPAGGARLAPGRHAVAGVAWAPIRGWPRSRCRSTAAPGPRPCCPSRSATPPGASGAGRGTPAPGATACGCGRPTATARCRPNAARRPGPTAPPGTTRSRSSWPTAPEPSSVLAPEAPGFRPAAAARTTFR